MSEAAPRRWMPYVVVRDIAQLEHAGRVHFLDITVTAELAGEEPAPILPVRADLGRKIADLIRAECAQADAAFLVPPGALVPVPTPFHPEPASPYRAEIAQDEPARCTFLPDAGALGSARD